VLVTVLDADGAPTGSGVVYAVGAGEPGSNDEDAVFRATVEEPGPVRLRLPAAGLYDIGFRGDGGTTLVRDFRAVPGPGNAALLRVAPGVPVSFRIEGEWPPPGSESPMVQVSLWTEDAPGQVDFPGRGERGWASGTAFLTSSTGSSTPLETGRTYRVNAVLQEAPTWFRLEDSSRTLRVASPRYRLEPDRLEVRPGEGVVLRLIQEASVFLRVSGTLAPSESKGASVTSLFLGVWRGAELASAANLVLRRGKDGEVAPTHALLMPGPGPCRVAWSGDGLQAGECEVDLRPGEVREVAVPLRADPLGRAVPWPVAAEESPGTPPEPPPPLQVEAEGLPPGEEEFRIFGILRADGEVEVHEEFLEASGQEAELDADWRRVGEAAAVRPPYLASDFHPVPPSGPLRLPFRPAGLLAVVPLEVMPPEFGALRLRRADGRPIPVAEEGGTETAGVQETVDVLPALLIGPFPEGPLVFEVRLGGLRLPDARAVVKAGRIEVLRISR